MSEDLHDTASKKSKWFAAKYTLDFRSDPQYRNDPAFRGNVDTLTLHIEKAFEDGYLAGHHAGFAEAGTVRTARDEE